MMNRLVDALESTNIATYHNNPAINSLNYAINFLLTLAEIDHRLNICDMVYENCNSMLQQSRLSK